MPILPPGPLSGPSSRPIAPPPRGVTPAELGARAAAEQLFPVVIQRWQTAEDERTCPECAPLDGAVFELGFGPEPPLHNHCRCYRRFDHLEWRSRG